MELGHAEHRSGTDRRSGAPGSIRRTSGRQQEAVRSALGREARPHGGKKKSDDNGGEGVPEGLKQFNPKSPNTEATGTATNLATVEKPKKKSWDNGFDENIAKRFSAKRHVSLADLGEKMKIDTAKETKRFKQLIIGGHGNKDILATGSGDGPNTGDTLNLKATNKSTWLPFFNSSKFYGRAEIWILSCNVGSGSIPQLIADQSGSLVYAYTRTAYDNEKKPWASERGK
jgi:hypothetical protein